jgi:hypothetical protein
MWCGWKRKGRKRRKAAQGKGFRRKMQIVDNFFIVPNFESLKRTIYTNKKKNCRATINLLVASPHRFAPPFFALRSRAERKIKAPTCGAIFSKCF